MSGFPILDLVIGMVFVYFMLSLITSSLVEIVMSYFRLRARVLEKWLFAIFDKKMMQPDGKVVKLGQAIMDHCTTTALAEAGRATSYIDAKNFSTALLEKLTFDLAKPDDVAESLGDIIEKLKEKFAVDGTTLLSTELQRTMLTFAYEAQSEKKASGENSESEMQRFRKKIEYWFDSNMDRIEGKLKTKYSRPLTFWLGMAVVVGLNADSINIARYLYSNPDARAKVVAQATAAAGDTTYRKRIKQLELSATTISDSLAVEDLKTKQLELKKDINKLQEVVPLGWQATDIDQFRNSPEKTIAKKLAGWLATLLALMLGAPFWFDLLNKVVNLRGSGPKPASGTDAERKAADTDKK
jgi:hypothetical protein